MPDLVNALSPEVLGDALHTLTNCSLRMSSQVWSRKGLSIQIPAAVILVE